MRPTVGTAGGPMATLPVEDAPGMAVESRGEEVVSEGHIEGEDVPATK